jgi:hypothetical protein
VTACGDAAGLVDGQAVLVDGANGEVVADPSDQLIADAQRRRDAQTERRARSHGPGRTADGVSIPLLVNIGGPGDVAATSKADSEGVGPLRTEFLFLDRPTGPSFGEQVEASSATLASARHSSRVRSDSAARTSARQGRRHHPDVRFASRGGLSNRPQLIVERRRVGLGKPQPAHAECGVRLLLLGDVSQRLVGADVERTNDDAPAGESAEHRSVGIERRHGPSGGVGAGSTAIGGARDGGVAAGLGTPGVWLSLVGGSEIPCD